MVSVVVVIQIAIALAVLVPACYFDLRYRQVPNILWWVLGASGTAMTLYSAIDSGFEWQYVLVVAGFVLIIYAILVNEIEALLFRTIVFAATAACFVIPFAIKTDGISKSGIIVFATYVFVYVLYHFGIVRGGADAKCFMTMSMLIQTCPSLGSVPLISVPSDYAHFFPFSIMLLFHAALFTLAYLFWIVLRKVIRKKDPVKMVTLSCYTMSIEEARKSHVWSKQDVKDGTISMVSYIPDEGVYDRLEKVGAKEVWVTPIIPFMVPILAAFVFITVVGNIFFIPFGF